jgi:nicotinate-nucleotide adenylyltransferase
VARVLLFGGSFDPIHHGHLIVARCAAEALGVERTVLLPSARPPHKQDQTLGAAEDRLAMCRLAVDGDPQFDVDAWETEQSGPNYTLLTIEHFGAQLGPDVELCWLIGMDSLRELGTWYRASDLVDACTLVTVARPGQQPPDETFLARWFTPGRCAKLLHNIIASPEIGISSTEVRDRVQAGRSVRYLVPEAVAAFIARRGLYREG